MSSAGIRPPLQRPTPQPSQPQAPGRRAGDEAPADGGRREAPSGPRRPLPPVAAPQGPTHRPSPSRPPSQGRRRQEPAARQADDPRGHDQLHALRAARRTRRTRSAPGLAQGLVNPRGHPFPGPRHADPPDQGAMPGAPGRRPMPGPSRNIARAWHRPGPRSSTRRRRHKAKGRVGSSADRAGRRARRNERATERRVTSPQPAAALLNEEDETRRVRARRHQKAAAQRLAVAPVRKNDARSNRRSPCATSPR